MTAQPNAVPPIPEGSSTVMPWMSLDREMRSRGTSNHDENS